MSASEMRSLTSPPAPPEPRTQSLFNEMLFSNVFPGNWYRVVLLCFFFPFSLFFSSSHSAWLRGIVAADIAAG